MKTAARVLHFSAVALLTAAAAWGQQNATVVEKVFNGISTAATSGNVRNIGQAQHLLTILFPNAVEDVTGFSIGIEGSYDGTVYFPLHNPVTSALLNTNGKVYAMAVAAGPWQYVRVRSSTSVSSPLTVYYTGHNGPSYPLGAYLVDPPTPSISANWALCSSNCATGTNLTHYWIAPKYVGATKCFAAAKTGPTGSALIVDILNNGTSIFGVSKLQIAAGQTTGNTSTFSSAASIAEADLLTISITQVGSSTPGQYVTITCRLQ
jgi:hypothetical protein